MNWGNYKSQPHEQIQFTPSQLSRAVKNENHANAQNNAPVKNTQMNKGFQAKTETKNNKPQATNVWMEVGDNIAKSLGLNALVKSVKVALKNFSDMREIASEKISKELEKIKGGDQQKIDKSRTKIRSLEKRIDIRNFSNKYGILKQVASVENSSAGIQSIQKDGKLIVITKKDNEVSNISVTKKKTQKLGAGTFGNVYKTKELSGEAKVMKIARKGSRAKEDVKNEVTLLKEIHKNGNVRGIQAAPHSVISYEGKSGKKEGFIGVKYDGDAFKLFFLKPKLKSQQKQKAADQILEGKNALRDLGIFHGDIKPANMLFQRGSKGNLNVVLADFGGARKTDALIQGHVGFNGTHTPQYCSNKIKTLIEHEADTIYFLSKKNPLTDSEMKNLATAKANIKELYHQSDDYAIGLSLMGLFFGRQVPNNDLLKYQNQCIRERKDTGIQLKNLLIKSGATETQANEIVPMLMRGLVSA